MFKAKLINFDQEWEKFIKYNDDCIFVQAPQYGEFYKSMEEDYWIGGIFKENELVGGSLIVSVHAKRGDFLYLPYGPVLSKKLSKDERKQALSIFFDFVKASAEDLGFDFVRVSPYMDKTKEMVDFFKSLGFVNAPMHIIAETTWILDITPSQDKILAGMKKNHRNLIRRCERDGVRVESSKKLDDLSGLNELLDITAKRHKFKRFSHKYIQKEFKSFAQDDNALVFNAYLPDGSLDSSAVIIFYGNTAAYRHSASLNKNKHLPTSYCLQWEVIKEAKKRGIKIYNFWGIAPDNSGRNHPFRGITHFKKGFGGRKRNLLHCQDLPIRNKYYLNWLIESFRRVRRGF